MATFQTSLREGSGPLVLVLATMAEARAAAMMSNFNLIPYLLLLVIIN